MSYVDLVKTLRQKFSKKCDDPSGCANSKEDQKLKGALDESDPQRKSQVLPKFATMVDQIMQILGTIGMGGSGFGGGGSSSSSSSSGGSGGGVSNTDESDTTSEETPLPLTTMAIADMSLGVCGGMEIEAQKRGLTLVISQFSNVSVVDAGGSNALANDYQLILDNAFANLQSDAAASNNIPTSFIIPTPVVPIMEILPSGVGQQAKYVIRPFSNGYQPFNNDAFGIPVDNGEMFDLPSPIVDTIEDFFYCRFYANTNNPHPGYAEFHGLSNDDDVVYTLANTITMAESYDKAVQYDIQTNFAAEIDPYMEAANLTNQSITTVLDDVLRKYIKFSHETLFGNNAMDNMGQNMLPILQNMVQTAESDHLPNSVLNVGNIEKLLQDHKDDCSKGRKCVQLAKQALEPQQDDSGGGQGGGGSGGGQ